VVEYHGRVLHVEAVTREGDRIHLKSSGQVRPGDALSVAVDAERALFFPEAASDPAPASTSAAASEVPS
ncbi:MAG TPA: hypothetical protein VK599_23450, partial [Streptosporangiaceae bacterium]|nr:hypothetical protein [Streptosporangiaceae bacterium]